MKNLLQFKFSIIVCVLLALTSCTPDENETLCNCEEVLYQEVKYQEEITDIWLLSRTETSREAADCQDETDFIRTGNGTEVFRIECN